jgi:DNA replication protein DnaD
LKLALQKSPISIDNLSTTHFNQLNPLIYNLSLQTLIKAEQIIETYIQDANDKKTKLYNSRDKFKKPPIMYSIIAAIENR